MAESSELLNQAGLRPQVMIDCSHAISGKNHMNQQISCRSVIEQIKTGDQRIMGLMLESNLVEGAQRLGLGKTLGYGQSITDACIGWDETSELLQELADAVCSARAACATGVPT